MADIDPTAYTFPSDEDVFDPGTVIDEDAIPIDEMPDDKRRAAWQARRPNIDHLADGVAEHEGTFLPLFDVGDRIVAEVKTEFLKHVDGTIPWIYTLIGKVRSIDDDTGIVSLWDEGSDARNPMVRWVTVRTPALICIKLAPTRGNPFDAAKARVKAPVAPSTAPDGTPTKRGRGRPPGTRNRPKEVIAAEKAARKAAKGKK